MEYAKRILDWLINFKTISVNTDVPILNDTVTFKIPANTSDFQTTDFYRLPPSKDYHRYVSDIDYRIDTSGFYNITKTQIVQVPGLVPATRTIEPGYYSTNFITSSPLFNDWVKIAIAGPNAFKAVPVDTGGFPSSIDLTQADQIQSLFQWPAIISSPSTFVPNNTVDITQSQDFMFVYFSFCKQSTENSYTNAAAIPISGTIGSTINGTIKQTTPLLLGLDSISNPVVRLRDVNNNPFILNTPIIINAKILHSVKNKDVERDSYY